MGAADELARALAARDVNVGELIRQAEADARAEVAEMLEISEATVLRDWRSAKAWLAHEIREQA